MRSRTAPGGLMADIKPNQELRLRNSDYVLRNVGLHTCRVQIYVSEVKTTEKFKMKGEQSIPKSKI